MRARERLNDSKASESANRKAIVAAFVVVPLVDVFVEAFAGGFALQSILVLWLAVLPGLGRLEIATDGRALVPRARR